MTRASERDTQSAAWRTDTGDRPGGKPAVLFPVFAVVVCIAPFCSLTGCQAPPPDDAQMRAALTEALGAEPPQDCRLQGYAANRSDGAVTSWLASAGSPLRPSGEITLLHEQQARSATLLALFSATADQGSKPGTPLTEWCEYSEWERGSSTCRLWQMQTDSGWIACLETVAESSEG